MPEEDKKTMTTTPRNTLLAAAILAAAMAIPAGAAIFKDNFQLPSPAVTIPEPGAIQYTIDSGVINQTRDVSISQMALVTVGDGQLAATCNSSATGTVILSYGNWYGSSFGSLSDYGDKFRISTAGATGNVDATVTIWDNSSNTYKFSILLTGGTQQEMQIADFLDTVSGSKFANQAVDAVQLTLTFDGTSSASAATVTGFEVVPEPSTFALLGLATTGLVLRRRRK